MANLGDAVFSYCTSLEHIVFEATAMGAGTSCFQNCPQLVTAGPLGGDYNIEFGWTETIPDRIFSYSDMSGAALTSIVLPNTIKRIGERAFSMCGNLTEIILPNGLETIDNLAFFYCVSLAGIDIPPSVIYVGHNAFESCVGLRYANLRFASSNFKVNDPSDGWFPQTNLYVLELHIPTIISPEMSFLVYGQYWNCHSYGGGQYNTIPFTNDL